MQSYLPEDVDAGPNILSVRFSYLFSGSNLNVDIFSDIVKALFFLTSSYRHHYICYSVLFLLLAVIINFSLMRIKSLGNMFTATYEAEVKTRSLQWGNPP